MAPSTRKRPLFFLHRAQACRRRLMTRIDPRTLHDFRTSLRRLEAVLRLEKPLLGKQRFKSEIEQIKYLQGLTGPLRDADVSSKILKSAGLSPKRAASPRRSGLEKAFRDVLADKAFDRIFSDIARGLRETEREERREKFQRKVKSSFGKEMGRIRKALRDYHRQGPQEKILHHLRIRAKRLRYDLELFDFLDPPKRKKLLKAANKAQDVLGQLRDWKAVERPLQGLGPAAEATGGKVFEILRGREKVLLRQALKAIDRLEQAVH
jgi:CHAD domain-containing protein